MCVEGKYRDEGGILVTEVSRGPVAMEISWKSKWVPPAHV